MVLHMYVGPISFVVLVLYMLDWHLFKVTCPVFVYVYLVWTTNLKMNQVLQWSIGMLYINSL